MLPSTSIAHALALARVDGVGPVLFKRLVAAFGGPAQVFQATAEDLQKLEGVGEKGAEVIAQRLAREPPWADLEREIEEAIGLSVDILHLGGESYPPLLAAIHDPPPILYRRGKPHFQDQRAIALVGTRKPTPYGETQAAQIASELAASGVTVISGLAIGIDGCAHRAALDAGGRTVAVMGSGFAQVYPREHQRLFDEMVERGAVYSEFPAQAPPEGRNFPRRNRVISGLSLGVLVLEAGEQSGSLITARCAAEQGREVYALPGNVSSPYSRGTNRLIRQGARLVEGARDILEDLAPLLQSAPNEPHPKAIRERPVFPSLSAEEQAVAALLGLEPTHMDLLGQKAGIGPGSIGGLMLQLELKGAAQSLGGGYYIVGRQGVGPITGNRD